MLCWWCPSALEKLLIFKLLVIATITAYKLEISSSTFIFITFSYSPLECDFMLGPDWSSRNRDY